MGVGFSIGTPSHGSKVSWNVCTTIKTVRVRFPLCPFERCNGIYDLVLLVILIIDTFYLIFVFLYLCVVVLFNTFYLNFIFVLCVEVLFNTFYLG